MDPVCVEALINRSSCLQEIRKRRIANHNMHRRQSLLLIETPDVKFVNGMDAGNLRLLGVNHDSDSDSGEALAFSRSCCTSSRSTPFGALSRRINPDFHTIRVSLYFRLTRG